MTAKKAAWIICQNAGSPRHGMNYRPYYAARELAARGVDVTIVSGSTSHEFYAPPATTGRYTLENVDGIRYVWIRTPEYGESRSAGRAAAWLVYLAGLYGLRRIGLPAPDAIVVSSPPPFPILPAAGMARRCGARLVFEVRDLWPLSLVELGGISPRHPLVRLTQWVEEYAYRVSDVVISVLPAAEPHMRSRGLAAGKFRSIPNGVRASAARSGSPSGLVRGALPGRRFVVGYLGKVGIAYGLDTLVSAAALLADRPDIGIAVVGEGTYRASLEERARAEGLGNIAFLPPVPKGEVPGILAELDACYLGLRAQELFRFGVSPTKLFDYMLAARPIIMGIRAGNDPVAEAGCGLTVPPEDPRALAQAIAAMADLDEETRKRLGAAGRAYVERQHDWASLGDAYFAALGLDGER